MKIKITIIALICASIMSCVSTKKHVYRDGEGNVIPRYAVDSLVLGQFAHLSAPGKDTVSKYFYFKD